MEGRAGEEAAGQVICWLCKGPINDPGQMVTVTRTEFPVQPDPNERHCHVSCLFGPDGVPIAVNKED